MSADSIKTKTGAHIEKYGPVSKGNTTLKPARKLAYFVIFWLLMIGSVVGFILEGLLSVLLLPPLSWRTFAIT